MPQAKPKPSDIAAEAKRIFFPQVEKRCPNLPPQSIFYPDVARLQIRPGSIPKRKLRVAVIDGDPLDVALDWHDYNQRGGDHSTPPSNHEGIPVVNMANEKRAGGDWESGLMAPEECLCRRSNLVQALKTAYDPSSPLQHYPIPSNGGIYSPHVGMLSASYIPSSNSVVFCCVELSPSPVVFRSGPEDNYAPWSRFKTLPVISVAPVRRPKLDESGTDYSFDQEREIMKDKMRSVLRIAAYHQRHDLCMGAFGLGPGFRNPVSQIASMWKELLFDEVEFHGVFSNVVFAIENNADNTSKDGFTDHEIFKREFDPSNIVKTTFRKMADKK
ncbi:MAG: hypothetical protein L6R37_005432 [Teloschistes peruensis]|nr:MAG: hypothetical protein L6R37_005432 [Teloschistes peruensis]